MSSTLYFRETIAGQLIRQLGGKWLLPYPEDSSDFVVPFKYRMGDIVDDKEKDSGDTNATEEPPCDDTFSARRDTESGSVQQPGEPEQKVTTSEAQALKLLEKENYIIVDWYSENDSENPQNWAPWMKHGVLINLFIATFAVYAGSSIITLGYDSLMQDFNIGIQKATLTLSMYILGYGAGAMLWSPLSEVPSIGRNVFYWGAMGVFVLLQVGAPLTHNFGGLVTIRFFTGFFGAPTLSMAGASLQDAYDPTKLAVVFSLWTLAAFFGPSGAPLIAGFAIEAKGWRWSMWELLWLVSFSELLLIVAMPETSNGNILLRRAKRLRALTGNERIRSMGELEQSQRTVSETLINAFLRPFQILVLDPQVLFSDIYIALLYCTYYLFFSAFPIWQDQLGWSIGIQGISYVVIVLGGTLGMTVYIIYQETYMASFYQTRGWPEPEKRLEQALPFSCIVPIGLFIFAWTAKPGIPWIAALIGVASVTFSNFIIFQCIFLYVALAYPQFAASLLAGNDFIRSSFAAALVHSGPPLYDNLTLAGGTSLLAGLTVVFIIPLVLIYKYGPSLRARSRFAV